MSHPSPSEHRAVHVFDGLHQSELTTLDKEFRNPVLVILTPLGYQFWSISAWIVRPVLVVVAAMSSTMVRRSVRGQPRQFIEMKLNMRCSILFHFEVPGG